MCGRNIFCYICWNSTAVHKSNAHFCLIVWVSSLLWPLGGVQQQNGPDNNLIPKGNPPSGLFLSVSLYCFMHSATLLLSLPPQMADAGGLPQLTQVMTNEQPLSDASNMDVKAATSAIIVFKHIW